MRCLCVSPSLPWPLHGGRQINAHYLLRGLIERGHEAHLAVLHRPEPALLSAWPLAARVPVTVLAAPAEAPAQPSGAVSRRWDAYFGSPAWVAAAVAQRAQRLQPDYVEACGLEVLPWLVQLPHGLPRIWLAADEGLLFHLTQFRSRAGLRAKATALAEGVRLAAYERSFARWIDAAVAVSPADRLALRRIGGFREVGLCPNGVDAAHFRPGAEAVEPDTLIFWGRLDFEPNLAAITWFARHVWPALRRRRPNLRWWIVGKSPSPALHAAVAGQQGIELIGPVADVRPWACRAAVTILPMRSGAGIKNKLLEAAAMARPIVASPRAVTGLEWDGPPPLRIAEGVLGWVGQVLDLLSDAGEASRLGAQARAWVKRRHDWARAAIWRERFVAQRLPERVGRDVRQPPTGAGTHRRAAA